MKTKPAARRTLRNACLLAALMTAAGLTLAGFCRTARAQSRSLRETAAWINTRGEALLKELTGNHSLQWELDGDGTLKITDRRPSGHGDAGLTLTYTYLNLYDLDAGRTALEAGAGGNRRLKLVIACRAEKEGCIKSRRHRGRAGSETRALSVFSLPLCEGAGTRTGGETLAAGLARAIRLFRTAHPSAGDGPR